MSDSSNDLARFHDVPLQVELQLGSIALDVQTILRLREGAVLKTSQAAGSGVRVLAGGVDIAGADILNANGKAAARITSITAPQARGGQRGNS